MACQGAGMAGGVPDITALNNNVVAAITALLMNPMAPAPDELIFGSDVNIYETFGGATPNEALFIDSIHPNQAGYDAIGDDLFDALTGATTAPAILQRCP